MLVQSDRERMAAEEVRKETERERAERLREEFPGWHDAELGLRPKYGYDAEGMPVW